VTERGGEGGGSGVDAHAPTEISGDGTHTGPRSKRSPLSRPTVGRFRIEATLGSGGMGDVYRAHDSVLDRQVALKVLRSEPGRGDDEQRRRRVVREARSAAALTHPNTVTIFDVGEDGNDVFIAMELLEGEDLRAKLERGGASLEQKLRWLRDAARALAAAHERGLVHRDVKPENMFVCNDGTLKLLDFGIAKREEEDSSPESDQERPVESIGPSSFKTAVGRRFGTPRYMAPEQHAGQPTDSRTDQYAWGLVAFELLTGSLAIDSLPTQTSDVDVADGSAVPTARYSELRAKVPELPESMARAVQRALEPKKDDRFASMSEVLAALEGSPVTLVPPPASPSERATAEVSPARVDTAPSLRSTRRRWLAAIATGLAAIAVVALVVRARIRASAVAPCRAVGERVVPTGPNDRIGFDTSGRLLFARSIDTKLTLQREGPNGELQEVKQPRFLEHMAGTYHKLEIFGVNARNRQMIAILTFQGLVLGADSISAFLVLFDAEENTFAQRLYGPIGGVAIRPFRDEVVAVVGGLGEARVLGLKPGLDTYFPARAGSTVLPTEHGAPRHPSIDASEERIAVVYNDSGKIRFLLLDGMANKVGDNHEVATTNASPSVAFDGRVSTVLWIDESNGNHRLTARSISLGEAAFGPPRILADEPATLFATVHLHRNRTGVVWVTSTGGDTLLRFARLEADGSLGTPATISRAGEISDIFVTQQPVEGAQIGWYDGAKTARVTTVTCLEPAR